MSTNNAYALPYTGDELNARLALLGNSTDEVASIPDSLNTLTEIGERTTETLDNMDTTLKDILSKISGGTSAYIETGSFEIKDPATNPNKGNAEQLEDFSQGYIDCLSAKEDTTYQQIGDSQFLIRRFPYENKFCLPRLSLNSNETYKLEGIYIALRASSEQPVIPEAYTNLGVTASVFANYQIPEGEKTLYLSKTSGIVRLVKTVTPAPDLDGKYHVATEAIKPTTVTTEEIADTKYTYFSVYGLLPGVYDWWAYYGPKEEAQA